MRPLRCHAMSAPNTTTSHDQRPRPEPGEERGRDPDAGQLHARADPRGERVGLHRLAGVHRDPGEQHVGQVEHVERDDQHPPCSRSHGRPSRRSVATTHPRPRRRTNGSASCTSFIVGACAVADEQARYPLGRPQHRNAREREEAPTTAACEHDPEQEERKERDDIGAGGRRAGRSATSRATPRCGGTSQKRNPEVASPTASAGVTRRTRAASIREP